MVNMREAISWAWKVAHVVFKLIFLVRHGSRILSYYSDQAADKYTYKNPKDTLDDTNDCAHHTIICPGWESNSRILA